MLITGEETSKRAADRKLRKQALKIAKDNLTMIMSEWRLNVVNFLVE
jgi:hypothetical protein